MTKEQFLSEWGFRVDGEFSKDLDAVIATEVAKVQEAKPKPEYICYKCKNKTNNKFVICDKCNIGWNKPEQETVEPTEQPAKPFDKDRFERMFCSVVANGGHELDCKEAINLTQVALSELDAFYASKEGGNNE